MGLMAFTNHLAGRVNGNGNGGGGYELNGRGVLPNWGVVGKERLVKTNLFPSAHEGLRFRPGALSFSVGGRVLAKARFVGDIKLWWILVLWCSALRWRWDGVDTCWTRGIPSMSSGRSRVRYTSNPIGFTPVLSFTIS